ncbi:hypothetical protein SCHPADRAFT_422680 [Schizopora paradoxa]|uniref:Uncharacterized protein n=1 Tax=Schizopora paradoxa TaxID=27342 RepID=A0A0H2RSE6_9AGAM|nr:hypothetical protein SCHPADRAFT_422680 [Schizopora paradoxa]
MAIAAGPAVDSRRRDIESMDNSLDSLEQKIRLEMGMFGRTFSSASSETVVDDRREFTTRPLFIPSKAFDNLSSSDVEFRRGDFEDTKVQLRWSQVIPPETGLTFAAVWDPEDGMITFSPPALSSCSHEESKLGATFAGAPDDSPVDVSVRGLESRSQILLLDPNTYCGGVSPAPDTALLAYRKEFCPAISTGNLDGQFLSDESAGHFVPSVSELGLSDVPCRSSAGTSGILDNFLRPVSKTQIQLLQLRPTGRVQPAIPVQHSRSNRYKFIHRNAAVVQGRPNESKISMHSPQHHNDKVSTATPRVLGSVFDGSFWNRSVPVLNLHLDDLGDVRDYATLDLRHELREDGTLGDLEDGQEVYLELDYHVDPGMANMKSAFSWSSTSTSRYIDVQTFLDTATTPVPLGNGGLEDEERFASVLAEWVSVEPPSPPSGAWRREQPSPPSQRKLHKPKPIIIPRHNPIHGYYYLMQSQDACHCEDRPPVNNPAPASEVLARQSYNHQWGTASQYASSTSRNLTEGRPDPGAGHTETKPRTVCKGDIFDVLKGVKSAMPWQARQSRRTGAPSHERKFHISRPMELQSKRSRSHSRSKSSQTHSSSRNHSTTDFFVDVPPREVPPLPPLPAGLAKAAADAKTCPVPAESRGRSRSVRDTADAPLSCKVTHGEHHKASNWTRRALGVAKLPYSHSRAHRKACSDGDVVLVQMSVKEDAWVNLDIMPPTTTK